MHLVHNRKGEQPCWQCKGPRTLNKQHDSYCCTYCDIWLEPVCNEPGDCEFCKTKPRRPSGAGAGGVL